MFSEGVRLGEFKAFLLVVCQTLLCGEDFVAVVTLFAVLLLCCFGRVRDEVDVFFLLRLSL